MTQRERLSSEGHGRPGANPVAAGNAARVGKGSNGALASWEAIFQSASASEQQELLALARRQGVLYAHQLPSAANGISDQDFDRCRRLVALALAGRTDDWAPVSPQPVACNDCALDAPQREAVARALATPDLFLLQGLPGTGKSRVVAEVVTQAAARGDRVLFLSPTPGALDRLLEEVGDRDVLCPIRCVGADEDVNALAGAARSFTFAERVRLLGENTLGGARREAETLEHRRTGLRRDEAVLARMGELAAEQERLDCQALALRQALAAVEGDVEEVARTAAETRESCLSEGMPGGTFAADVAARAHRRREVCVSADGELKTITEQVAAERRQLAELNARLADLLPLVEAKRGRRWWQKAWWRALLRSKLAAEVAETEALIRAGQAATESLEEQAGVCRQKRADAEAAFRADRTRLVEEETARRRGDIDSRLAAVCHELEVVGEKWRLACSDLHDRALEPKRPHPSDVEATRTACREQLTKTEEQLAFARQWVRCLEDAGAQLPDRLRQYVNLVAATTTALAGDSNFGDRTSHGATFDLLVLEGADQVTESEFLRVSRRARRWVLIGEPALEPHEAGTTAGPRPGESLRGRAAAVLPARSSAMRTGFFHRLWRQLHCDPRRLGYGWVREQDRLCCRLRPLGADQRQWVQSERVADFPDVELRILSAPRTAPELVEVVFPPSMDILRAKEYVYRELEELPVWPAGGGWNWVDEPERVVLYFAAERNPQASAVDLGSGVCEFVATKLPEAPGAAQPLWSTCRIEFDRKAGWHRRRAEEWVHTHVGLRDLGRTLRLDVPYRMAPELAAVLSGLLFGGAYRTPSPARASTPAVEQVLGNGNGPRVGGNGRMHHFEFVPVPAVGPGELAPPVGRPAGQEHRPRGLQGPASAAPVIARAGRGAVRRPAPAGAGLELDLTDRRHRDRLPAELRPLLPDLGFVNYLEAQAVVRTLEGLAAEALAVSERGPAPSADCPPQGPHEGYRNGDLHCPSLDVGVMALYPAQVQLIRILMRQSPSLDGSRLNIQVDVPEAFRERECSVGLLSLTRSHGHRAVTFGDGPESLNLGLTRARSKLIVFGDVATLIRRSQWEGRLDHLDEASSARERDLIAGLVRYAQTHGPEPGLVTAREASGS